VAVAALAVAALAGLVLVLGGQAALAAATWPNTTDPTTTAPGSEAISHSLCKAFGAKDSCEFVTTNQDRFLIVLPDELLSKVADGTQPDAMDVIAAVIKLPGRYAPANISGVGCCVSVSPSYAAKLATVGMTPGQLLGWLEQNVPPAERAPWIPGSANALDAGPARQAGTGPAQRPRLSPAAIKTTHTGASAPESAPAYPKPAPLPAGESGRPTFGSPTSSAVVSTSAQLAPATGKTTGPAPPGTVAPNAPPCPAGFSELNAPNGGRCLPDEALGVAPGREHLWWRNPALGLAASAGAFAALAASVSLRRGRRRSGRA
jgi:hypothetical protein